MLKKALYLVIGAACGSAITYFIMSDRFEAKLKETRSSYQDEIDRLVEVKHQRVIAERNEMLKSNLNFDDVIKSKEDEEPEITITFTKDSSESNYIPKTSRRVNKKDDMEEKYNNKKAYLDKYESDMEDEPDDFDDEEEDIEDEDEESYVPTYPKEGPNAKPYGITPDDYMGYPHLDKQTLIYWTHDGTLATEDDEDVTNEILNTVGNDFEDYFGEYVPGVAYIRNDMNGTDYEILRRAGSFKEMVLGEY